MLLKIWSGGEGRKSMGILIRALIKCLPDEDMRPKRRKSYVAA
jgi:hypothetical protein